MRGIWKWVRGPDAHDHFGVDTADLDGSYGEAARAYIQQLLSVAADDARNVLLLATVSIATVVFLVRDLGATVSKMEGIWGYVALGAVALLLVAGGLLYAYSAEINARRMDLARCLASEDASKAREVWAGTDYGMHRERGRLLTIGFSCMIAGALAAFAVVIRTL